MQRALGRRGRLCAATAKRKTGRYDLTRRIAWSGSAPLRSPASRWSRRDAAAAAAARQHARRPPSGGSPRAERRSPTSASRRTRASTFSTPACPTPCRADRHLERLPAAARVPARERAGGATLVPYLAQDMPTVSADGMTYTLMLRKGLKYSNGTPVKASDFTAHDRARLQARLAGRRLLRQHRRRRRVRARRRRATSPASSPTTRREDHDHAEDAAGRLRVHPRERVRGARSGERAGEGHLDAPASGDGPVRHPELQAEQAGGRGPQPAVPRRHVRRERSGRQPRQDDVDIFGDPGSRSSGRCRGRTTTTSPAAERSSPSRRASTATRSRSTRRRTPTTYFMNTRVAPFDNLKVRQAVNYAIDREALVASTAALRRRRRTSCRRRIRSTRSSTSIRTTSRRRSS